MQRAYDSRKESIFDDYQQRDYFSLETLVETEFACSPISIMLECWLHLRHGQTRPPRFDEFNFEKLWEHKIPRHVALIDCSAEDPANFYVVYHPYDITNTPWCLTSAPLGHIEGFS